MRFEWAQGTERRATKASGGGSPVEPEELHEPPGPQRPVQYDGQVHHAAG